MKLLSPFPLAGLLVQAEQIHEIGADAAALGILRPPHAIGVLRLVQKDLAVQGGELLHRVHVEEKQPPGQEEGVDPLKGLLQLFGVGDIVHAVQAADAGIDGAVQVQLLHGLTQENGRDDVLPQVPVLLRRLSEHLRGQVHPDHLIATQGQLSGEGAGAAGQI